MITTSIIKQGDKLHIKVGDEISIKNIGGNYSTYDTFFDEREEELVEQMGEPTFIMAKSIYIDTMKREGHVDIKKRKYRVIGMAKHIDRREQEVLVLLDEFDGQVYLFCNRAMYLDIDKSSNDYNEINLRDIVADYGNHIMLRLDNDTVLYIDNE
jgi:hypothetical protein